MEEDMKRLKGDVVVLLVFLFALSVGMVFGCVYYSLRGPRSEVGPVLGNYIHLNQE